MALAPNCKWAQRKDLIMFTIILPDVDPEKTEIEVKETSFSFKTPRTGTEDWELSFNFFGEVDPSRCKKLFGPKEVSFIFYRKKEGSYWDRLNKGNKIATLKCDWDRWKDEDGADEEEEPVNSSVYDDIDNQFGGPGLGRLMKELNESGRLEDMKKVDWLAQAEKHARATLGEDMSGEELPQMPRLYN